MKNTNKKVRVGVFGAARGNTMIDQLLHNPDAELAAVCDKFEPALEKVKTKAVELGLNVAFFTDFEDFIKCDMDAVVLANYATEHGTFAVRCLNAGKHVMSEVLPTETLAQAVELAEAVERTGLVYAYAENYCYMKGPFEMWRRYANGDVGEVMYAEAEYIHDCASIWPEITYGDKDHWRNHLHPCFYNTHSFGPIITATGLRPVQVVGFEPPLNDNLKNYEIGFARSPGIEMVTLENGAVVKSIHGPLKRPHGLTYRLFGKNGSLETDMYNADVMNCYVEGDTLCEGTTERYEPETDVGHGGSDGVKGHGGSDFFPTYCFIQKILGKKDGKWSIDIYQALDMSLCGILAYRSVLGGNVPVKVPNFRNKAEREAYRHDNACCNRAVCGKDALPCSSHPMPIFSDEVYDRVKEIWLSKTEDDG